MTDVEDPISAEIFADAMDALGVEWSGVTAVAVAVSGGPDSMALCALLKGWAEHQNIAVHALSIDHGLRPESMDEARQVGRWLERWPGIQHHILKWEAPAQSAIQEEARKARYAMMAQYCREKGIAQLCLGHHRDDQAETVLFRLSKGSGLDGLSGMRAVQLYDDHLALLRPFLDMPKAALIETCRAHDLEYLEDPANQNGDFARVRLRSARAILEEEGLTSKRLAVTAKRLGRARRALDELAEKIVKDAVLEKNTKRIVLKYKDLASQPEEIMLRCVLKVVEDLRPESDYAPRMEKAEALLDDLRSSDSFRKRTLGGVIFERNDKDGTLSFTLEGSGS